MKSCGNAMHRGLVAAILGTGLLSGLPLSAGADAPTTQLVGRQADGSVVLTTNQVIRPAGTHVEFRGRPTAVVIHPDGKTAALLNGSYNALIVIDLVTGTVKQEMADIGSNGSFNGLVYSKDGKKLYASETQRIVVANVADDGRLTLDRYLTSLPNSTHAYPGREDGRPYPGGLALSEDGSRLYITLNRNNSLGVYDLATDSFVKEIPVGNAPHAVVVKGTLAYVSNQGGRPAVAGDFTNDSSGTAIVADTGSGRAITGSVSVVDLAVGKEIRTIEVDEQPTALLLDGKRLFVANTNSDTVSIIDTEAGKVTKTISIEPFPGAPLGSSPNGLALMDEQHLVVSLGRNNALAVYKLGRRHYDSVSFEGLIPTGWYPTAVAADPLNSRLVVANGKGVGSLGPEATAGPDAATNKTGKYVHSNMGSTSIVLFPKNYELETYSKIVYANNSWTGMHRRAEPNRGDGRGKDGEHGKQKPERHKLKPEPMPAQTGAPSVFKHVFYIIKENRTYDQIFGDLSQGNGDLGMLQFGREVTPNQHALAEQFVLLDNLYDSGSNSADGHQWVTQAFVTDYIEKSYGGFTRTYPFNAGDALVYPGSGFLWENALKHGKTVRVYGEYVSGLRADGVEMGAYFAAS